MHFYPKRYKDLYASKEEERRLARLGAEGVSLNNIATRFQEFYKSAYAILWRFFVTQIWLESRILFDGKTQTDFYDNPIRMCPALKAFFTLQVGIPSTPITNTRLWPVVLSYFREFYPEYMEHDPEIEPEYYNFPYKNITIEYLAFVYQLENRKDFLNLAEEGQMSYAEFINWVTNWVLSYNDEVGDEIYTVRRYNDNVLYIKNLKKPKKYRSI
jgi:hypothetical protein